MRNLSFFYKGTWTQELILKTFSGDFVSTQYSRLLFVVRDSCGKQLLSSVLMLAADTLNSQYLATWKPAQADTDKIGPGLYRYGVTLFRTDKTENIVLIGSEEFEVKPAEAQV